MDRRSRRAPPERPLTVTIRWPAVLFGALTGLAASLAVFVVLGVVGVIDTARDSIPLILLIYGGQFLAGYIGGRYAATNAALHGGLAALGLFFLTSAFSVAAGNDPALATIVVSLVVAAVIGTAGGALAEGRDQER